MTPHTPMPSRTLGRLKDYSLGAAAIATGVFGLAPQEANAAIVQFSNSGSLTVGTASSATINLVDGGSLFFSAGADYLYLRSSYGLGGQWANSGAIGNDVVPSVLGANTAINADYAAVTSPQAANPVLGGVKQAGWTTSFTDQYIGFVDGMGDKGYLKVSWDAVGEVFSWNDGAIQTGGSDLSTPGAALPPNPAAVPEPGSLALLVAGAVGLARRRRAH